MALTTRTVVQEFDGPDGGVASGQVEIWLSQSVKNATKALTEGHKILTLDVSGNITTTLYANDDAASVPSNSHYIVEERITGAPTRRYKISVPSAGSGNLNLWDLVIP